MLTYEESLSQGSSFGGGGGFGAGGSGSDLVQIKPQRVDMRLRMGKLHLNNHINNV